MAFHHIFHLASVNREERELIEASRPANVMIDVVEDAEDPRWEQMLARADAVITGGHVLTAAELNRAPRLKAVQMRGVGWQDRVPAAELQARGIRLAICRVGTAEAVAEHALMFILALQRCLLSADASVRAGRYIHANPALRKRSHRLAGATVGLIGMGRIGRELARLLAPMGIRGLYHSRTALDPTKVELHKFRHVPLETLLAESDVISLHLPGGDETRHIIGADEIAKMKPGAILVNTARGSIVDQPALTSALQSGHLGGVGLDVFDPEPPAPNDPLLAFPNVIVTPHIAAAQRETFGEKIDFCIGNLAQFLATGKLENEIFL